MTRDFKLKNRCPHHVRGEWVTIEPDLRTIRPLEIPSSSDIELHWNGIQVPRDGVDAPARTRTTDRGPFQIERGNNDVVALSVDGKAIQEIEIPPGPSVGLERVVLALREGLEDVKVEKDERGITFRTYRAGPSATLFLRGGSAHATIGLPDRRMYRGAQVFPGWELNKRRGTVITEDRVLVLDEKARADDNIYELHYYTRRQDCRRCQGLGVEQDIRYDGRGEPVTVEGADLLLQEMQKIVFTVRGSNVFHQWYGTSLMDLIGQKIGPDGAVMESRMAAEIGTALEKWREIKLRQSAVQDVSPEEMISRVVEIRVEQDPSDPTLFNIDIVVQNRAGELRSTRNSFLVRSQGDEFDLIG